MQTVKNLNDISNVKNVVLREYIAKKATQLIQGNRQPHPNIDSALKMC